MHNECSLIILDAFMGKNCRKKNCKHKFDQDILWLPIHTIKVTRTDEYTGTEWESEVNASRN